MSQRNLLILLVMTAVSYACYVRGDQDPYVRYVASGLAEIEEKSLQPVPSRELFHGAMQGMIAVLQTHGDEHSQFLSEEEADPLRAEIRQQFGGIGVRIQMLGDPPQLTIVGPPDPGTPAARANLLPGDVILAIDDRQTAEMNMADVLRLMRGDPGETIRLVIQHEHQAKRRKVELVREIIMIESILGDIRKPDGSWDYRLPADPRIALIRVTSFGEKTAEELDRVLNELIASGVEAVVLDERDNVGGALDAAVDVCELLLPPGKLIVETRGREQQLRQRYVTAGEGHHADLPLIVLVNQNSASAAEIVAACLQDYGRAAIGGQRSYGKGTVQQLIPIESGRSLIKLTWASFWRPSGANIHRHPADAEEGAWGVIPDEGLARNLSPEQYAVYRQQRNHRDMLGQAGVSSAANANSPESPKPDKESESTAAADLLQAGPPDSFVDIQLAAAVEFLQQQLAEREK